MFNIWFRIKYSLNYVRTGLTLLYLLCNPLNIESEVSTTPEKVASVNLSVNPSLCLLCRGRCCIYFLSVVFIYLSVSVYIVNQYELCVKIFNKHFFVDIKLPKYTSSFHFQLQYASVCKYL